jgi:hypothetical protein
MDDNIFMKNIASPEARMALDQMKAEMSRELDIADPQATDRGNLTSRQNGYVGGYIEKTKKQFNIEHKGTKIT